MTPESITRALELVDRIRDSVPFIAKQDYTAFIAAREELRTLLAAPNWTYTEEGLPEEEAMCWFVVCDFGKRGVELGYRSGNWWWRLEDDSHSFSPNDAECWLPVTVPELPEVRKIVGN